MQSSRISWNDMIKKEAKGMSNASFGDVRSVGPDFVYTEKGTVSKSKYYLPKYLVRGFDGKTLWFNITEGQAEAEFKRDMPPSANEYERYGQATGADVDVDTVPAI
jgi:hypothetical protein